MFEDEIGTATFTPEPPEPYLFDVGDTIDGRYLVRAQLGNGGMGAVLRVEDQTTHETLALKYCKPNQNRRRFAREVRLMESIQSPYVIPISGSNLDHEPPYFVMPLAERSLETDLPSLVGDEATGLEIFRQVCLGVQDLHARGVFHRDLKPANVLRLPNGRMVVCDLGLARPENRDTTVLTRSIGWVGTEAYLRRNSDSLRGAGIRTPGRTSTSSERSSIRSSPGNTRGRSITQSCRVAWTTSLRRPPPRMLGIATSPSRISKPP